MARVDDIQNYLRQHYPCGSIPTGELTAIATMFGVSRQNVHQIKLRIGLSGAALPKRKMTRRCGCGAEVAWPSRYCESCKVMTLVCFQCGVEFTRTRKLAVSNMRYTQHDFCGRACSARYLSDYRKTHYWSPRQRKG